jgi:uncharacterized protein (TIGR02996 family)
MSLTEDDWLLKIAADRDNDDLRLMFADWLEEQSDAARAEFIRVQIRLAALPLSAPERYTLTVREQTLLAQHRDVWLTKTPKALRRSYTFRRGFAAQLECSARQWLDSAEQLCQANPLLEWLSLTRVAEKHPAVLAASSSLAQLTTLALGWRGPIGDAGTRLLATSPYLGWLTRLILNSNELGAGGAAAIADSPHLVHLRELYLSSNHIGDAGAEALAVSPSLSRLRVLVLSSNQIGSRGAATLAASPCLAHLTVLNLDSNQIEDEGATALATSPYLGQINTLSLLGNLIGAVAATALRKRFGKNLLFC